ncbi:MAG: gfo/Idh/MocA family oxidoreductase [Pirellulales bacterium]
MRYRKFICLLSLSLAAVFCRAACAKEGVLRAGIVGCDTSHVIAFTDLINKSDASGSLANVEVTVAFPGGSDDLPASRDRLPDFVAQLRKKGVTIVDSLEELADQCDAILLESVDGRVHLGQFREIAKGKPVFVDKPAAASLADVMAIFHIAEATKTPVFSSSSLRFVDEVPALAGDATIGELLGCETSGPMPIEPHHPDLFWYGIHGVEPLYAIMGEGCESVSRTDSDTSSLVVGKWRDGRIGSFRGLKKGQAKYAATVFGTNGVAHRAGFSGYEPLVREICEFFHTGKPPVSRHETIEIFAFMEAADESKRRGGEPVVIAEVIERAEREVASRKAEIEPAAAR